MAAKKKAKAKKKAPAKKVAKTSKKTASKKNASKKAPAKKAKKTVKAPAKKVVAKKAAPAKKAKTSAPVKAVSKKSAPAKKAEPGILARAITAVKTAVTPAKKKPAKKKQIVGEGDYAASKAFLKDQSSFVERHKSEIPKLAKDAEAALEGPEGADLTAAEEEGRSHSVAGHEE
jgi:hypothetical protein